MDQELNDEFLTAAVDEAIRWARKVLADENCVILDTETTGLSYTDQVCQVAVIDMQGHTLLDELVKPTCTFNAKAVAVHGITEETVKDAPVFEELIPKLVEILKGKIVITYNAEFDARVLFQSNRTSTALNTFRFDCAMEQYAAYVGEWNDYHGNFRRQRLPGGDHSALGDCLATLEVIRRMARSNLSEEMDAILKGGKE